MHAHGITPWTPKIRKPFCWLRADRGISLVSGALAAWSDIGGSGRDFAQGTPLNRLGYSTSEAAFNGCPAIVGTGAGWADAIGPWTRAQPTTIYLVGTAGSAASWRTFFDVGTAADEIAGYREAVRADPTNALATYAGSTNVFSASVAAPSIIATVFNGASSAHYVNSVIAGGTSSPGTQGIGTPRIGAGVSGNFPMLSGSYLCEVVVIAGADSTEQRAQMFRYFRGRYRLAVAGL